MRNSRARRMWLNWKHFIWGDALLWREANAMQHAWYLFWDWVECAVWRRGIYPHLRPRTWMRKEYEFLLLIRVPPRLIGYIEGEPDAGYAVTLCEVDGPRYMGPFCGHTEEEAKHEAVEFLKWAEDEAGPVGDGWTVQWQAGGPSQHTYTR